MTHLEPHACEHAGGKLSMTVEKPVEGAGTQRWRQIYASS